MVFVLVEDWWYGDLVGETWVLPCVELKLRNEKFTVPLFARAVV